MLIEFIQNAFFDSTLLYLYLGIYLLTYVLMYVSFLYKRNFFQRDYVLFNHHKYSKINVSQMERPLIVNEPFLIWFILMFKRSSEADDQEDSLTSYFKKKPKIRGGLLWKRATYSQPLRNIYL